MPASIASAMPSDTSVRTSYVYRFGGGTADGDGTQKRLLGGKGAGLAEMSRIGLPVPPGFTISTEACAFVAEHEAWPDGLDEQVEAGIAFLEEQLGRRLGDPARPLLVSVRSGAAVSMPGMMDTVLNLGLNDAVAAGLARETGDERFAYDAYRRFIDMFGDVVMGVSHEHFEDAFQRLKNERGAKSDTDLTAADLRELVGRYQALYRRHTGYMFPADPREQLRFAIDAVFGSWMGDRAVRYRQINDIRGLVGTAVNVQAMVYGNMSHDSGTGVCFTRNPSTGEPRLYGEFLANAQGEDVVAGIRTPQPISEMESAFPEAYRELVAITEKLEEHYQDMLDLEFTVQDGTLYILQSRSGKRTGAAALRIAVDLVREGLVSERQAVARLVEPRHIDQLLHPRFASVRGDKAQVIGKGLPASPGAAVGRVVFNAADAEAWAAKGEDVILVRVETSPEDVGGMNAAKGILTSRGGMTSHAAVVARGWGKPCVAGCGDIIVHYETHSFATPTATVREGDWISLDGSTGEVILGRQPLVDPEISGDFEIVMGWADKVRTMRVRTNADTPADAEKAVAFGAEGIGLCRTEHMFFEGDRIWSMRKMIVAQTDDERRAALDELLPLQLEDFAGIFRAMKGRPVTIRLLDPPLHEFLPKETAEQQTLSEKAGLTLEEVHERAEFLAETNPMLGHRGCRLGITYPAITEMQARAIAEAVLVVRGEGITVRPEIMVPLVGTKAELAHQRRVIERVLDEVLGEMHTDVLVGTMIEVPRAALQAGALAEEAAFFSFGTNDLTQMAFGFSRDDAGTFLPSYTERGILPDDPFQTLDIEGVGELMKIATERGRATRPDLKIGLCGEHGGDPASVDFCARLGLDYVSCSPFRVPVARLAAAQAALRQA